MQLDAGKEFGKRSDLGQRDKSVMLPLRQDTVLRSGAKSWTRQIVDLPNIKNSLPTGCGLGEELLQAWPGNNTRLFHLIIFEY